MSAKSRPESRFTVPYKTAVPGTAPSASIEVLSPLPDSEWMGIKNQMGSRAGKIDGPGFSAVVR